MHQPASRFYRWAPIAKLYGHILEVQSDQDGWGKQGENILHHKPIFVLLQSNAFWFEKYKSHLSDTSQPYVEVYVDDMLVKSTKEAQHLDNLQETFDTLSDTT